MLVSNLYMFLHHNQSLKQMEDCQSSPYVKFYIIEMISYMTYETGIPGFWDVMSRRPVIQGYSGEMVKTD